MTHSPRTGRAPIVLGLCSGTHDYLRRPPGGRAVHRHGRGGATHRHGRGGRRRRQAHQRLPGALHRLAAEHGRAHPRRGRPRRLQLRPPAPATWPPAPAALPYLLHPAAAPKCGRAPALSRACTPSPGPASSIFSSAVSPPARVTGVETHLTHADVRTEPPGGMDSAPAADAGPCSWSTAWGKAQRRVRAPGQHHLLTSNPADTRDPRS